MSRDPKTQNLFIKNCVSTLMCLNFSHLPSIFHLMQYTYTDIFSTAQNSFWTHRSWCLLVLPFFVSPLPHWQNISLWGLLLSRKTKESCWGEIQWIRRVGHGGCAVFGQKMPNSQQVWAGALVNHPSWNGQMHCKKLQKKLTEAEHSFSQQC